MRLEYKMYFEIEVFLASERDSAWFYLNPREAGVILNKAFGFLHVFLMRQVNFQSQTPTYDGRNSILECPVEGQIVG